MIDLIEETRLRAGAHDMEWILRRMGYQVVRAKTLARLEHVLASNQLGLETPWFDFRHDSRSFAETLCVALGIDSSNIRYFLERAEETLFSQRWSWRPWLFVDTEFTRRAEPLFVLAACESIRRLTLPIGLGQRPLVEQLHVVRERIREHLAETGGKLTLWGEIHRYLYWYTDNAALIFSAEGIITGESSAQPSEARLQLR